MQRTEALVLTVAADLAEVESRLKSGDVECLVLRACGGPVGMGQGTNVAQWIRGGPASPTASPVRGL